MSVFCEHVSVCVVLVLWCEREWCECGCAGYRV